MYLHWILTLMVTLLHCFTARPTTTNTFGDMTAAIEKVLQTNSCNENDSTFYSPSDHRCIIQALNCAVEELNVVKSECFEPTNRNARFVERSQKFIKQLLKENTVQGDSKNCPCEEGPKKSYKDFLLNIITLGQMMNSLPKKD